MATVFRKMLLHFFSLSFIFFSFFHILRFILLFIYAAVVAFSTVNKKKRAKMKMRTKIKSLNVRKFLVLLAVHRFADTINLTTSQICYHRECNSFVWISIDKISFFFFSFSLIKFIAFFFCSFFFRFFFLFFWRKFHWE